MTNDGGPMRNIFIFTLAALILVILAGCPPQSGEDGDAFVAIDYNFAAPYSYEDSNASIPNNPNYGEFYNCEPGTYNFEYYVDQNQYWYGTYEVFINEGNGGGGFSVDGHDGDDTYLIIWCDPAGPDLERFQVDGNSGEDSPDFVEKQIVKGQYGIIINARRGGN